MIISFLIGFLVGCGVAAIGLKTYDYYTRQRYVTRFLNESSLYPKFESRIEGYKDSY